MSKPIFTTALADSKNDAQFKSVESNSKANISLCLKAWHSVSVKQRFPTSVPRHTRISSLCVRGATSYYNASNFIHIKLARDSLLNLREPRTKKRLGNTGTQETLSEESFLALSLYPWKQESISPTFYVRIFCTKVFWSAILFLEFGFEQTFVQKMRS